MEDRQIILYACPHCNILLMMIDEQTHQPAYCELDRSGEYAAYDYGLNICIEYTCPTCGTGTETMHKGRLLRAITFNSLKPVNALRNLWHKLKDGDDLYDDGLPLDLPEIKAIIMENSIGD